MIRMHYPGLSILGFLSCVAPALAQDAASASRNVFQGRVLDHEGRPVASAQVAAVDAETGFLAYSSPESILLHVPGENWPGENGTGENGRRHARVNADSEGRFRFEGLIPGKYSMLAVHRERGLVLVAAAEPPAQGAPLDLKLDPPTFLEVDIRGLNSKGAPGFATLRPVSPMSWQRGAGRDPSRIVVSLHESFTGDAQFRLGPLPAGGTWRLEVFRPIPKRGFNATLLSMPVRVQEGKTERLRLDLNGGPQVTGQVLGPQGEPLADVSVTATAGGASGEGQGASQRKHGALTDADGRYIIRGLPEGAHRLEGKRWLRRKGPG